MAFRQDEALGGTIDAPGNGHLFPMGHLFRGVGTALETALNSRSIGIIAEDDEGAIKFIRSRTHDGADDG